VIMAPTFDFGSPSGSPPISYRCGKARCVKRFTSRTILTGQGCLLCRPCVGERAEPGFSVGDGGKDVQQVAVDRASRSSRVTISTSDVVLCDRPDGGSEVEELAFDVFLPANSHKA